MRNSIYWFMILTTVAGLASAQAATKAPRAGITKDPISLTVLAIAEPYKSLLDQTLKKDKGLRTRLELFEAEKSKIREDKHFSEAEKNRALQKVAQLHVPLMKEWFSKAAVSEVKYQTEVERFFKNHEVTTKRKYAVHYRGFLSYSWQFIPVRKAPLLADKEILIEAPFVNREEHRNGLGSTIANVDTGRYLVSAEALLASGHENSAGFAHFQIVDERYDDIEAAVALPEVGYSLTADSVLLGAAGASTHSHVEVLANKEVVCSETIQDAAVIAPVLWFTSVGGLDNVVVGCEFNAPQIGDEIVVRFHSRAGAWGGGFAVGIAVNDGTLRDIRLRLKY